jgi:long-chain acyl-CoA synthetase
MGHFNLNELLDDAAIRWPDKPVLIDGDKIISYAGLAQKIADLTARLRTLPLISGCRIGLSYPNSIEYVALTFALWRVDAVVVPVPMDDTAEEFATLATSMQLDAVISQKPRAGSTEISPDCFFTRLSPATPADNHGLNLAFIRFTSGTTNARKGVALTHETIRARVTTANKALRIGPDDVVVWSLPMAHHFLITIILYLSEGATIVLARHVLAKPYLEAVSRWRGTVLYAAPFHFALLARDDSGARLDSVRLAVSTTCGLPQAVAEEFHKRFGRPLLPALGIIELGLVSLNTDDPLGRWNSVGRPLADHQVRILAPDENGCGEVAVRGPGFFDAYVAPWIPRERVAPDGWFTTGDIGRLDADGFLLLISRQTAVINLAGRKVFPEEIEAVLNRHPLVRESRVFGRTHPHLGEVVEAELVLAEPGAPLDSVREFCRDHLAAYKIPTRLHVVADLPRTPVTGKIRRAAAVA